MCSSEESQKLATPENTDDLSEVVRLQVPEPQPKEMKKSHSMSSLTSAFREKFKKRREKFRKNQCCGIITFLVLGTMLNVVAYLASVWSAQLQKDVIKLAVEQEHALQYKIKKTFTDAPSQYLIGLLNFCGRVASALGIVLLVQVVAAYMKRRKYNPIVRSAAEEADLIIGDMHGGMTDSVGECCLNCFQAFV